METSTEPTTTHDETKPTEGASPEGGAGAGDAGADDEFQLTIRKLEMPVRPRGVLAD